jgi:hypothetical protein
MKEVYHQIQQHQQQQQQQQQEIETSMTTTSQHTRRHRFKELEQTIKNQKSLISYDGLLDGIQALVLDCEPMKKNKNIENFLCRCKNLILYCFYFCIFALIYLNRKKTGLILNILMRNESI